jgi:hypothetical protein
VVEIRFLGEVKTPVAFTRSGSSYWLGEPAPEFGLDAAQEFVYRKCQAPQDDDTDCDPSRPVTIPLVADTPAPVRAAAGSDDKTKALSLDDIDRWIRRL